jgi:iron(III) transport system ATP-binding protein
MLTVEHLTKLYDRAERGGSGSGGIRDASFALQPGDFFTLLGPSGCGKTTTLRCIAGLERPDDGVIRFGESAVFDASQRIHVPVNERGIGMVFQSYAIWPHMSVFENVAFPLKARRRATKLSRDDIRRRVEDSLRRVNLADYGPRNATMLSGGEQQRVAFARAIVGEPKLLLLDEPLSNLDAALREQMRSELLRLQRQLGITTVYVTHDQTEALTLSDRIAVVDRGRVLQIGPPAEIYLRPQSEFVARFVGSTNILYGRSLPGADAAETKVAAVGSVGKSGEAMLSVDIGLDRPLGCVAPAGMGANGEAAVSVRPESIDIDPFDIKPGGDRKDENLNVLHGEVAAMTFMGASLRYDVRVADRMLCVVAPPRRVFSVGDKVTLRFRFENAVAIAPERRL